MKPQLVTLCPCSTCRISRPPTGSALLWVSLSTWCCTTSCCNRGFFIHVAGFLFRHLCHQHVRPTACCSTHQQSSSNTYHQKCCHSLRCDCQWHQQQHTSNTCCMASQYLSESIRNQRTSQVLKFQLGHQHSSPHTNETFENLRVSCITPFLLHSSNGLMHIFTCRAGSRHHLRQEERKDTHGDRTRCLTQQAACSRCWHRALLLCAAEAW